MIVGVVAIRVSNSAKDGKERKPRDFIPKADQTPKCSNSNLITVTHY